MKATIIETGETIYDAVEYEFDTDQYMVKGRTKDGEYIRKWANEVIMLPSELQQESGIDWEQRRYEIVKDVVISLITRSGIDKDNLDKETDFLENYDRIRGKRYKYIPIAVKCANIIINELGRL